MLNETDLHEWRISRDDMSKCVLKNRKLHSSTIQKHGFFDDMSKCVTKSIEFDGFTSENKKNGTACQNL